MKGEDKVKVSWKIMAVITIMFAALLSYGVYFTQCMPAEKQTVKTLCVYRQNISSDYLAYLKPNILYGETAGKGETIYLKLAERIDVNFNYTFECSREGKISIEHEVNSVLEAPGENGWIKPVDELVSIDISEEKDAASAVLTAKFSYNVSEINGLIGRIEEEIGVRRQRYQIITTVRINMTDRTDVGNISRTIEEPIVLKFNYDYMGIYGESRGVIEIEAVEKHLPGSITMNQKEAIGSVLSMRIVTIITLVAWLAAGGSLTTWRYRVNKAEFNRLSEAEKIMRRFKVIESEDIPDLKIQTLSSFEDLKRLVDEYDLRIFHTKMSEGDVFFTVDNNMVYRYSVSYHE